MVEENKIPDQQDSQSVKPGSPMPLREVERETQAQPTAQQAQPSAVEPPSILEPPSTQAEEIKIPKKGIPRTWFLIAGFVIVFGVLVFLLLKFMPGKLGKFFGKRGEVVLWGFREESIVAPLIEEYQAQNPKVKITYIAQSTQDYRERLKNSFLRGDGPDIFQFHNSWVPMFKKELDILPSSVMSVSEFSKTYYPVIVSDLKTTEGIVGIPLEYDAITLFINEDIFAAAGRTPPRTWDELRELAVKLTSTSEKDKGIIIQGGVALGRTENIDHWQEIVALMMIQNGANLADPKGTFAEDAIEFFTVFSLEDKVWNEYLPSSTIAFANGKVAMYFGPTWRASEINKLNPNLRFKAVPLPQLRKEDPKEPDISYATYWVEGVWSKSANKDIAWDFLKFLSTKDSLQKIYEDTEKVRLFGESYPRVDMSELLIEHEVLGSVITLAPNAKSWYLADETYDGFEGINSQISEAYKQAIDEVVKGKSPERVLPTAAENVIKVLSRFGIKVW